MKEYKLYAGLGGGFGGAEYQDTVECASLADAEMGAYELACEIYWSYSGMYGLPSYSDIEADPEAYGLDEYSDEAAEEILQEDLESWIEYYAEEVE